MNKAQLIDRLSKLTKEHKASCKRFLESFIEVVGDEMRKGRQVALTRFGTFTVLKRKARTGVNPATGKKMQIPAKRVPKFRAGKALRHLVK